MRVDRLVGTDFLIDRWRHGEASDASAYARAHQEDSLAISWIVKGEFLRAAAIAGHDSPALLEFLARYPTHWPDEEVVVGYARLGVMLRGRSLIFGRGGSLACCLDVASRRPACDAGHNVAWQGAGPEA